MKNSILLATLFFLSPSAQATLNPDQVLGESVVRHKIPGWFRKGSEICVIPTHIPGAAYSPKDLEQEQELCGYVVDENVAACPKTNSTNPGVNFFIPPAGMSIKDLTREECEVKEADKVAKYKLSISCSYTPSLLVYYHVSRALGGVLNIPVVVLRTMDIKRHRDLGKRAERLLKSKPDEAITKWWQELNSDLSRPNRSDRMDLLFTDDLDQSYGALQRNPRGEKTYAEFNTKQDPREMEFKNSNPIYKALVNPATRVPTEFTAANVQQLQQLKDAADFILIDTLLNQQDRFGNIHYREKFFYLEAGKVHREKDLDSVPAELRAGAVKIKEMLLKDNDCGVNKDPRIKQAQLLDGVAHMDPRTYSALLAFDRDIEAPASKEFFQKGMLFRDVDLKKVTANVHEATALLKARCKSGALQLDLDLEAHFTGKAPPPPAACGI